VSIYPDNIPRCQHIKVNGIQCGSPALRGAKRCYFHNQWRETHINLYSKAHVRGSIDFPVLEDANSIQISLMQIMRLVVSGQLDSKTAGLLLYGLQTASNNLSRTTFEPFPPKVVIDPDWVADTSLGENAWHKEDFEGDEEEDEEQDGDETSVDDENTDEETEGDQNAHDETNADEELELDPEEPFDPNNLTNAQVEAIFREVDALEAEQKGS
jgi:hypothetical protein